MARKSSDSKKKLPESPQPQPEQIRLERAGQVIVEHHVTPPTGPTDKQIHLRRPLPPIPDAPSSPREAKDKKDE
jgi:hypothetical protein